MNYELTLSIPCGTAQTTDIIIASLSPEIQQRMPKANILLNAKNKLLILTIEANDISTLRAATNSYIRWIETALNVHQLV
jgi:tRNA threonylcarbamoyladenosine modification (KEOPS) complex  Pcc1 subunit